MKSDRGIWDGFMEEMAIELAFFQEGQDFANLKIHIKQKCYISYLICYVIERAGKEGCYMGAGGGHSFNEYLLSSYHVLVPMLGMGNLEMDPAQYHP